jgi:hypothetical protein
MTGKSGFYSADKKNAFSVSSLLIDHVCPPVLVVVASGLPFFLRRHDEVVKKTRIVVFRIVGERVNGVTLDVRTTSRINLIRAGLLDSNGGVLHGRASLVWVQKNAAFDV